MSRALPALLALAGCAGEGALVAADAATDISRPEVGCDCADVGGAPGEDAPPDAACTPWRVEPTRMRVATGSAASFRVVGASQRLVLFRADAPDGGTRGTRVTLGGNVVAGDEAARFDVIAEDGLCDTRVRAEVEVVGPLRVAPAFARVRPGASVRFAVTGALGPARWTAVSPVPSSLGRLDPMSATFTTATAEGTATWVVRDDIGGQEVSVSVIVARDAALRPAVPVVLVPAGQRVRVDFEGGSSELDATLEPGGAGGGLVRAPDGLWFDAARATPGVATVNVVDRVTQARAAARVVVGETLTTAPVVRGERYASGALAWGDFNGDGRPDLAAGQPNVHAAAAYGGRVAVYIARPDGALPEAATYAFDGPRRNDAMGRNVLAADVNRDGVSDLVIATPERDLSRLNMGTVEVRLGARDGFAAEPVQAFFGTSESARFGASVAVEDVVGDPRPELIVVGPGYRGPAIHPGPCAPTGRVFIYQGTSDTPRPFSAAPWQTLELTVADEDPARCHDTEVLNVIGAPALFDADGDGTRDLVVGAPSQIVTDRSGFGGRVLVFRGLGRAMGFERRPSRVVSLVERTDGASFGEGVDVVQTTAGAALIVRAPAYRRDPATNTLGPEPRGALFVFAQGAFAGAGTAAAPRFLTTSLARTRLVGVAHDAIGAAGAVGDVDGDGERDYLVAGWQAFNAVPGKVWLFTGPSLARALGGAALAPAWSQAGAEGETFGSALAVDDGAMGTASAVAVAASARTTPVGSYTGAVDVIAPSPRADMATRWRARRSIALLQRGGDDAFGTSVALGALGSGRVADALVGAPLASTPAGMVPRARSGGVWMFPQGARSASQSFAGDRESAQIGRAVATLDFNGDGRVDVAVGDPGAAAGGWDVVRRGAVATPPDDRCFLHTATGALVDASAVNRGVVRIYTQQADGRLVERFHVYGREPDGERGQRGGVGGYVANARDVNGDGREDLVVSHSGAYGGAGAEVVLGRADDAMGRVQVACGDPAEAPWWPRRALGGYDTAVGLGDLDGDGCGEVAASVLGDSQAGVSVRFGFGPRCARGHTAPFELGIVAEQSRLDDNRAGDLASRANDDSDRRPLSGMGSVVAAPGDVTGDRVPDLLLRTSSWALGDFTDPAVEVISGALIARQCPDRRCPPGRTGALWVDGEYRRVSFQDVRPPERFVIRSPLENDPGFGASLAGVDLDGDGFSEVVVGAPGSSYQSALAGAVMAWRGGAMGAALAGAPWLLAVGDLDANTRFGASLAVTPSRTPAGAFLAVGAPDTGEQGPGTGAALRWFVPR